MHELSGIQTSELVRELSMRDGVKQEIVEPYQEKEIKVNGPAIVLVVID